MIEMKIIMALMLRSYDTIPAYDELDKKNKITGRRTTPEGERSYQVLIGTAKPAGGMPVRVKRR